ADLIEGTADELLEFHRRDVDRVAEEDSGCSPEDLAQSPVRDALAVGEAPSPVDRGRRGPRVGTDDELLGESCLPDPGLPEERNERRMSLLEAASVQGLEQGELVPTSD